VEGVAQDQSARRDAGRRGPWGRALLVGVLVVGTWAYALAIFNPRTQASATAAGQVAGPYASDLYPAWYAARARLGQGRDPYSQAVTADIQRGFFGRVLAPDEPGITEAFVYPLYTVFLLAPLTLVPFEVVKPLVYLAWPLLAGATVLGWIAALGGRFDRQTRILLALLGLSSIPTIAATLLQQPSVLVAALLAGAAYCLARAAGAGEPNAERSPPAARFTFHVSRCTPSFLWYAGAGALLAVATIKPQLSGVLTVWLLGWAASDARRRGGLLLGFAGTLGVLLAGAFAVQPGWVGAWRGALDDYTRYATDRSILDTWLPGPLSVAALVALGAAGAWFAWRTRQAGPGSRAFSLGLAFSGLFSILAFPGWAAYNQLILFPAALLLLLARDTLYALGRAGRWAYLVALDLVLWPWATAVLVLVGWPLIGALPAATGERLGGLAVLLPWVTSLITPVVLLAPLGLLAWQVGRTPRPAPLPERPAREGMR
jgi:hypothetical protein